MIDTSPEALRRLANLIEIDLNNPYAREDLDLGRVHSAVHRLRTLAAEKEGAQPAAVPPSYVVVPEHPTSEIKKAMVISREGCAVYKVTSAEGIRALEDEAADDYRAAIAARPAVPAEGGVQDGVYLHWCKTLVAALKRLSFAAQTSGGTAGRDEELEAAISQAEEALSLKAASMAIDAAQPAAEPQAPAAVADKLAEVSQDLHSAYVQRLALRELRDEWQRLGAALALYKASRKGGGHA